MFNANRNFIKTVDLSRDFELNDLASQYFRSKLMFNANRNFAKLDDLKLVLTIFKFVSNFNVFSSKRRLFNLKNRRRQKIHFSLFDSLNHDDRKL